MGSKLEKQYQNNLSVFLVLCAITAVVAKLIEHLFLPDYYFFDANRIISMVNEASPTSNWYKGTYKTAADFFKKINVFHFTEHIQWSIFLGLILTVVVIIMFSRIKALDTKQIIFGMMCVGLLNIYIFNISKDALQFGMFVLIYVVCSIDKLPILIKAVATGALMYWMSSIYRTYYIIMAFFFVVIFIVFFIIRKRIQKKQSSLKWFHYIFIIVGLYAMVCVFMIAAKSMYTNDYNQILEARNYANNQNQRSAIKEPIEHNGDLTKFLIDYAIDAVRMMFPIELIKEGVFYVPFFVFQVFMLFYVIRGIKNLDKISDKSFIGMCVFIAFFQGSVLFEPDFGSFVRHEAATFPAIILMVYDSYMWDPKAISQIEYEKEVSSQMMQEEYTEV